VAGALILPNWKVWPRTHRLPRHFSASASRNRLATWRERTEDWPRKAGVASFAGAKRRRVVAGLHGEFAQSATRAPTRDTIRGASLSPAPVRSSPFGRRRAADGLGKSRAKRGPALMGAVWDRATPYATRLLRSQVTLLSVNYL
jgi:hypothetical protein